ncbi:twin-arginine translocation signal domain-containing protein [Halorubrum sp. 2020YC2]|uniref:twin-arginine translocation signal domain-containing protein n=1 Tax=Halorubrum sp. 2020YC2 TaxID=2836432 RepID=UPI001BEC0D64|nr:twin-arginine translocation signal domain-containing protein [Halorubrum sp. 2020YC2]QWC18555.1 twin-arginine translocation signal domain-containing protein [Halorubrum sp. 2020YC2]
MTRGSGPDRGSSSRRGFLTGVATAGAAAVAGCSGLPFTGDEERREAPASLPSDAVGSVEWPAPPLPVTVPASLADAHEARARELLDAVPSDPDVPNAAVAAKIGTDREHAREHANADLPDEWPVDALAAWRRRREDAAEVRGAYRAATGTDDGSKLAARRRAVRDDRGALAGDLEYRAESSTAAVLAYEPVESLLAECASYVEPRVPYPADPVAEPFRAGEAVARVERAEAAAADADGLRAASLDERDEAAPRWASLVAAADELRGSVSRTRATARERLGGDEPLDDEDLSGTVAQELAATSETRVESAVDDVRRASDAGEHATVVVESGTALADIEAYRAAVRGIRDGEHRETPTEASVRSAAERARAAASGAVDAGDPLTARLVRPGLRVFGYAADRVKEGYGSARRTQASLTYAALYASAVPAAAEFVRERLES